MTNGLELYPEYRPSGLPWLEDIPAHWVMTRVKHLLREIDERSPTGTEPLFSMRQSLGLVYHRDVSTKPTEATSLIGYKQVQQGELVINRMRAAMGLIAVAPSAGLVSPDYAVFRRIDRVNVAYLAALFKSPWMKARFWVASKGLGTGSSGFLRLYSEVLNAMPLAIPPLCEQNRIVAFIQIWDRRLSAFIRNKQRLIALLSEQKQAIIDRAVTRGMDANAALAPSGIAWLGDVPEHWRICNLKQVALVRLSGVDKNSVEGERAVRLCNYTDVYKRDFITQEIEFMPATATEAEVVSLTLKRGDVLITKDSEMWDDIAVPALVVDDLANVLCGYHLAMIRPDPSQGTGEFLFRAFTAPTLARQFNVAATGVTRYGISKHTIKTAVFPLPDVEEQRSICRSLTDMLTPLASAIAHAQLEIDLAREYRTRLIADVVTGKLDVRHVVLEALPVMADGIATLDDVAESLAGDEAGEVDEVDGVEEDDAEG